MIEITDSKIEIARAEYRHYIQLEERIETLKRFIELPDSYVSIEDVLTILGIKKDAR